MNSIQRAEALLERAGITLKGSQPWDITVYDPRLYGRVLRRGSIGLGEAYMDGWWDAPQLDQFFERVLANDLDRLAAPKHQKLLADVTHRVFNYQSKRRAFQVGEHYNAGNDLYRRMLDSRMIYTCGYWKDATTLDEAQEAKLDLICRKLGLQPGMRVLDIGCGWGGFAKFAAERYHVSVVGITISVEQAKLAREECKGLSVEIRVQDYRDLNEKFDRIASIGMFEHVGYKNYRTYMETAHRCLVDDGLFLLHSIGSNCSVRRNDLWIDRYVFRNGMLPSATQIADAYECLFVMEDWHNFGADYDKTLMAWNKNFQETWPELKEAYSERFKRMWEYYLLACAASFRVRRNQLWQIVLSPKGVPGGYTSVR